MNQNLKLAAKMLFLMIMNHLLSRLKKASNKRKLKKSYKIKIKKLKFKIRLKKHKSKNLNV